MDAFPLSELASYGYSQTFDRRPGGHNGVDIFARQGTPVVAVAAGEARADTDPKGGKVVHLFADDGAQYYLAHLDDWSEPPLVPGRDVRVDVGAPLGHVGNTGNAKGTPPHLHFQVWLPEEGLVDPYQLLREVDPKGPDSDLPDLPVMPDVPQLPPSVRAPKERTATRSSAGLGAFVLVLAAALLMSKKRGGRWL